MTRFGSLFVRDGVSLTGQQVVPEGWIADTLNGGPDSRQRSPPVPTTPECPAACTATKCGFPVPVRMLFYAKACVVR
jgi:hypothetical protein